MPIYEYECEQCKKVYECILDSTEIDSIVECPDCKKECKKIMSPTFFHASMDSPLGLEPIQSAHPDGGITTKIPIIKDRKTGRTLSGPVFPGEE